MNAVPRQRAHAVVVAKMFALALGMFGFGYAMVPMYNIICDITGLNGKTGRVSVADASALQADADRTVIVEFVSTINAAGSWKFQPVESEMRIRPGQTYQTSYFAENLTNREMIGRAVPSVSPSAAAKHFNKTECFCFTQQEFEPLASKDMPLIFIVDPDLPLNVDRITLSYTFFTSPASQSTASLGSSFTRLSQEISQ